MKKTNKWFCIYTKARQEQIAFQELLLKGMDVYFPRYRRTINHSRKSHEKLFPLFPRYFFALYNNKVSFSSINRTRGVTYYIHQHDGTPFLIQEEIIDFIKSRENPCGYINLNYQRFNKEDKLLITNGTLASFSAIFVNQNDEERAKVLFNFMGREHILKMPLEHLDRQN